MKLIPKPVMPTLPEAEFEELKSSIAADGLKVPLRITDDHTIIDGHERYRAIQELNIKKFPLRVIGCLTEEERVRWAVEVNALRRHLSAAERRRLLEVYLGLSPQKSTREIAGIFKVHHSTVADTLNRIVGKPTRPNDKPAYSAETRQQAQEAASILNELGDAAPPGGASLRKLRNAAYQARAERDAEGPAGRLPANVEIHQCDFRKIEKQVGDLSGKVALACLDPPWSLDWAKENLEDLAAMTARVLRPGGICTCYVGQGSLPYFLDIFGRHLTYRWLLVCKNSTILTGKKAGCVKSMVRTVLLLSRGKFEPPHFVADLVEVAERDQRFLHPWNWQQPVEEYDYLVSRLTRPSDIIFDGTCGSGGVGEAVVRLGGGRRAILCDVDMKCVQIARKRVAEALVVAEGA